MLANQTIRIAPSGQPIGNSEGGAATPGNGYVLRMADAYNVSVSGIALSGAAISSEFAELANPDPNKRYWMRAELSLAATGGASASWDLFSSWSYDGGGSWNSEAASVQSRFTANAVNQGLFCVFTSPLRLGSALPGGGVTDGDPSLRVRLMGDSAVGAAQTSGSLLIQLFETL